MILSSRERWSASRGHQPIDTMLPELSATRETPLAFVCKRSFISDTLNCKRPDFRDVQLNGTIYPHKG